MTSQILNGCFGASRALAGRGLCSSLLVLLALGAVPSMGWAGDCNIVVTSNGDVTPIPPTNPCTVYPASPGSNCQLRYAIAKATPGQTICFADSLKGTTITLGSQLSIAKNLTIVGYGSISNGITISGNNAFRIFSIGNFAVTLEGLILTNGRPSSGNGGAITTLNNTILIIKNSTIKNSLSASNGGGIFNAGTMTINNSTIVQNEGVLGGGIYSTGALTIDSSTFGGNTASSSGGGIYSEEGGTVILSNSTASNNNYGPNPATNHAGAIYIGTPDFSDLKNNILANSIGGGGANEDCSANASSGFLQTSIYNIIEVDDSINSCLAGGSNNISADPNLAALANNGGPTQTMAINSSSPAYDVGDCGGATTDQRGVRRPQYTACDIGAYEASAKAGGNKLTLVKKGQCKTPCSGSNHIAYPPDVTYPQLSLNGVCWAYLNLENTTSATLTNITAELYSVSNNNWVLNTNTIPSQGGGGGVGPAVLITTPSGCTDSGIPAPTGSADSLAPNQTLNVWYKVGMMNAGPYYISTRLFVTQPGVSPQSFGLGHSRRPPIEELGEFTEEFDPQGKEMPIPQDYIGFRRLVE